MAVTHCGTHEKASVWFNKDIEGIGTSLFAEGILLFALITQLVWYFLCFQSRRCSFPMCHRMCFYRWFSRLQIVFCICCVCICIFNVCAQYWFKSRYVYESWRCSSQCLSFRHDIRRRRWFAAAMRNLWCVQTEKVTSLPVCSHFLCSSHRICNRCILKMDHHCPWINNCVGMLNMKFFLQFLIYTFVFCTLVFICTIISLSHGIDDSDAKDRPCFSYPWWL